MHDLFHRFAQSTSAAVGSPWAFAAAVTAIVLWALTGPAVGFSTTWQLVINTGTTIVTFLIVFLIQNTQNRESRAIQLKLDELILASTASNQALDLEDVTDKEAAAMLKQFHELAQRISPQLD
jgi:low affinity Fe/Cu permease